MGSSQDYPNVSDWVVKDTGYQAGEMVKFEGNIFQASCWAGIGVSNYVKFMEN